MNQLYTYGIQLLFVCGIAVGITYASVEDESQVHDFVEDDEGLAYAYEGHVDETSSERSSNLNFDDRRKWLDVARYVIYLLTIKAIPHFCELLQKYHTGRYINVNQVAANGKDYAVTYLGGLSLLLYFGERLFREDLVYVGLAYLVIKYPEMATKPSINYGTGMACSFFEGYLVHIIPSDGARFIGFEENIRVLEAREGVLFPVKKLFIIITKNLFCPPDLKEFNKGYDVPYLEAFNALEDVQKSVAGVKNRVYRNTAYKVYRPGGAGAGVGVGAGGAGALPPVCVAAECATPLHTLHRVLNNRALYREVEDIDVPGVVNDFCTTLQSIIDKSPQCRGKCELVYFDNEDPKQNLAEILLDKIRELAPNFEEQIIARKQENVIEE